jgi:hypothetical protein
MCSCERHAYVRWFCSRVHRVVVSNLCVHMLARLGCVRWVVAKASDVRRWRLDARCCSVLPASSSRLGVVVLVMCGMLD